MQKGRTTKLTGLAQRTATQASQGSQGCGTAQAAAAASSWGITCLTLTARTTSLACTPQTACEAGLCRPE